MILKRLEKPFLNTSLVIGTASGVLYENKHSKSGNLYIDLSNAISTANVNTYVYSGYNTEHMIFHTASGAISGQDTHITHLDNLGYFVKIVPIVTGATANAIQITLELNENV